MSLTRVLFILLVALTAGIPASSLAMAGVEPCERYLRHTFSFPAQIDLRYQHLMSELGLDTETIRDFNKIGLAQTRIGSEGLRTRALIYREGISKLDLIRAYTSAASAVNPKTTVWQVVHAVQFHETLHRVYQNLRFVLDPFKELVLGGQEMEYAGEIKGALLNLYPQLRETMANAPTEIFLEELLVKLVWEETLFQNGVRVIERINAELTRREQPPLPRDKTLEFIRKESAEYAEDRDRIVNRFATYAKFAVDKRIENSDEIKIEIERIMRPKKRKSLSVSQVEDLELADVLRTVNYFTTAPYMIGDLRLLEPVIDDDGEILSRQKAQSDLTRKRHSQSRDLPARISEWHESAVGRQSIFQFEEMVEIITATTIDLENWKSHLRLDSRARLTHSELKALVHLDVTGLFEDLARLDLLLDDIESPRLKALKWMTQSVTDPLHPWGLFKYFERLSTGGPYERDQALIELIGKKSAEFKSLEAAYREVKFLLLLIDLGEAISGRIFPTVVPRAVGQPPLLRILNGQNPGLIRAPPKNGVVATSVPFSGSDAPYMGGNLASAAIVYGKNENGKSTSFRGWGQLITLGSLGVRLPVDEMTFTPMNVHAVMRAQENLKAGLSRHAGNIEAVNQVAKAVKADSNAVVFIDELATGTDHVAGFATELAYLEWFIRQGALVFVATHKQEIARQIAKDLRSRVVVGTAENLQVQLGRPNRQVLIQGALDTLKAHDTFPEITARAQDIVRSRKAP